MASTEVHFPNYRLTKEDLGRALRELLGKQDIVITVSD
jgi:hypothetical protein